MGIIEKTVRDIKSLKIQGASEVRRSAVEALLKASEESKATTEEIYRKEFLKNASALFSSRPTEPELRTAITIIKKSISEKDLTVKEMKRKLFIAVKNYESDRKRAMEEIANFTASMIRPGATILTHCHSHSVIAGIIKAKKKINEVYCCEARPLYQGRMTARDLSSAGIKTTLIVDGAVSSIAKDCDYFLSGADAILADGDLVNKIGTNTISTVCKRFEVPHYVCTSTHKFEPATFFGKNEPIEERSADEILEKKLRGKIHIKNPAFDRTDSDMIEGIICEYGILSPDQLVSLLYQKLDLSKHHKDFFRL